MTALLFALVAGCSGDDGGGGSTHPCEDAFGIIFFGPLCAFAGPVDDDGDGGDSSSSNAGPSFTSGTTSSVPENQTDTGYTAQAEDPDGDTVTYSLVGGADQDAFSIGASSGVLVFVTAPDFENPGDSDGNSDYVVDIKAADGNGNSATQKLIVTVTDIQGFNASVAPGDDPKELAFSWAFDDIADAFRLEVNPDGVSGFTPADVDGDGDTDTDDELDGNVTGVEIVVALHLTHFVNALYHVVALDVDGNEIDRSEELSVMNLMVEQLIGYFKASNTGEGDFFGGFPLALGISHDRTIGRSVALSAEGDTLVVGAPREDTGATGINGKELDDCSESTFANCAQDSGAVYVFNRDDSGAWSQQAYIKASNTDPGDEFGLSVALADDGDTLAIGSWREHSNATGIDGDESNNAASGAGAVYVFVRDTSGAWSKQAYVKASNTDSDDGFGGSVALSGDGATLAVGAIGEDSAATGIDDGQSDNSAAGAGATYVFNRDASGIWSQQAYVKASNAGTGDGFGASVALSGDGATLAVGAPGEDSAATGIDGDQFDSTTGAGAVYLFIRDASGLWSQQAYVKASNTDASDGFGRSVMLSEDGAMLVVGAPQEDSAGTGIDSDEADNSAADAGAVYVFVSDSSSAWSQQAYVKASNTAANDSFGFNLALSGDGATLAVGAPSEDSGATGIDGDAADNSASLAGAVYVFTSNGVGIQFQQSYIKASNTDSSEFFGASVALSDIGDTLAVGAPGEDSTATGVDGDQADNSATNAGAVYLY